MLTIEGQPAAFDNFSEFQQICYAGDRTFKVKLYDSYHEVQRLIKKNKKTREKEGYDSKGYDYCLVEVEE